MGVFALSTEEIGLYENQVMVSGYYFTFAAVKDVYIFTFKALVGCFSSWAPRNTKLQWIYNTRAKLEDQAVSVYILVVWSFCSVCGGVEIDKSICDRNKECSVLKGLASTPEVCFHSLIREQRRSQFKQASKLISFNRPDKSLLETCL